MAGRFGSKHPGPSPSYWRARCTATKMNASSSKPPRTAPKAFAVVVEQPFFRGLSQAQLRTLALWSKRCHLPRAGGQCYSTGRADSARQTWLESDELIFREGDTANRFYLIVAGKVALEVPQSPRPKQWIAVCRG